MRLTFLTFTLISIFATSAISQRPPASTIPSDFAGVYQIIANDRTLAGGLRNMGSPEDIALLPPALQQMKTVDLSSDPEKMCQPIGPFRMIAREGNKIELVPGLAHGMLVMFFEDVSHGLMRTIYLNRNHPEKLNLNWLGDSIGRWERDTLVIDTVGFNDRTWLNAQGAPHSEALHLVEQIRPILGGKYLEYKVTAEDPEVLAKAYTYTRYYEKLKTEIMEDVCEE